MGGEVFPDMMAAISLWYGCRDAAMPPKRMEIGMGPDMMAAMPPDAMGGNADIAMMGQTMAAMPPGMGGMGPRHATNRMPKE